MADANLSSNTITLDADQVKAIRKAMLIGLASYGEIERLCNQAGLQESFGRPLPEEARPIHPTGCADTVGVFADALVYLNDL